ncbi:uncharacterized protein PV09_09160 [Verruconis gallopava]|uniref:YAG7-like dimerisation domain-containing protein n=1 Tax=Verruconis gallopava TaxID=253628 RepID=A0A0D2AJL8_9PEZI|nr:uncharacterized protein PV09_09160 [Verruconis gallopava]KIV99128.1 hypothetical protein PV09_09160 [Verruconis gallopava]
MASLANKILPSVVTGAESKSAHKKKAKAATDATSSTPDGDRSGSVAGLDSDLKTEGASGAENPYIRDLQKRIRNINKKLTATSKLDTILSENPGKSLDELVAARIINPDQKAQALKKPSLQAELVAVEDQLVRAKEMEAQHQDALNRERELLKSQHTKELQEMKQATEARVKLEAEQAFKIKLLTFGRFLKAAAARRSEGEEELDLDGRAFEGVLSNVYTGDVSAVEAIEKLINGVNEKIRDYIGEMDVTYARIKELTLKEVPVEDEDPWSAKAEVPVDSLAATTCITSDDALPYSADPTISNAALTKMGDAKTIPNGQSAEIDVQTITPATGDIGKNAGNVAAEEQWDAKPAGESSAGMEDSYEIVPRPTDEVENKQTTPTAPASTQSWAEEAHAAANNGQAASTNGNDGFHEVTHRGPRQHRGWGPGDRGRGRGSGRGNFRGRGGERADFRGRGRGAPRGALRDRGD